MKESLKKVLNYSLLAVLIVPCTFFLVACGKTNTPTPTPTPEETSTISGNYLFSGISVGWTEDVTNEQKAAFLAGDPDDPDDDMTEEDFFASIEQMMSEGDMSFESPNFTSSLEVSETTNRAFLVTEGFDVNIVTTGNIYEMTYNDETSYNEFTIGEVTYAINYNYYDEVSETYTSAIIDDTSVYIVTANQFTIGDTSYTLNSNNDFVTDGSFFEVDDDIVIIDETEYTVSVLNSTVTDGTDTYTITDGEFSIGDTTYTVHYEAASDVSLIYFSFNETTNTMSLYEDATMTIVVEGEGAPDSLDVNGNTISYDMQNDDMPGLKITLSFTKSA